MRVEQITAIATGLIGLVSSQSTCAGVAAARFSYSVDSAYRVTKVAGNLQNPRGVVVDSAGRLLVVESGKGISQHAVDANGCITSSKTLVALTGLNHGIYLSPDGTKLFASSMGTVYRWSYTASTGALGTDQTTVVKSISSSSHSTRTLAISPKNPELLVVAHGSDTNLDMASISASVGRAIVKVFNISSTPSGGWNWGTDGWNAGYGLRNEVGLAFDGNSMLWGVENSADDFRRTVNGVATDIHKDNPAEEVNYLGDVTKPNNQWYGYPTCFTVGDPSVFEAGANLKIGDQFVLTPNSTFNDTNCARQSVPPKLVLPAHTAPLDAKFDSTFSNMYVTLHGSWNRSPASGYSLVRIPFTKAADGSYTPGAASSVKNILYSANAGSCSSSSCVRPVGLAWASAQRLFMTSDTSGELFRIDTA